MKCKLVDVFSDQKFSGNGLTIFYDLPPLSAEKMLSLTQEMRQFESIFVTRKISSSSFRARVFTMEEELDFAGHPLIGLGAHLHEEYGVFDEHHWDIQLNGKRIKLRSNLTCSYYEVSMSQGRPEFIKQLNTEASREILAALNLSEHNTKGYPLEVISLGLPYLIVPITHGVNQAAINHSSFEALLAQHGAKFVYVLDVVNKEGRTWDNQGAVEDIATGSAAGPAAYYLHKHKLLDASQTQTNSSTALPSSSKALSFTLAQGRFVGRPSTMDVSIKTHNNVIEDIIVRGQVAKVAAINFV